jgi:hypothetical protein
MPTRYIQAIVSAAEKLMSMSQNSTDTFYKASSNRKGSFGTSKVSDEACKLITYVGIQKAS